MAKSNNFRIGLSRTELIKKAVELGKPPEQAKKTNTARLETYVARRTDIGNKIVKRPIRESKDFSYGLNRSELKNVAKELGMKEKRVAKASTKELETYIAKYAANGKPSKSVSLSEKDKAGVRLYYDRFNDINSFKAIKHLLYKVNGEVSIQRNKENNYLRLSIAEATRVLYEGEITSKMLDDLQALFEQNDVGISDTVALRSSAKTIIENYLDELEENEVDNAE
jgi:cob(I)alamin adenosyltransferase